MLCIGTFASNRVLPSKKKSYYSVAKQLEEENEGRYGVFIHGYKVFRALGRV